VKIDDRVEPKIFYKFARATDLAGGWSSPHMCGKIERSKREREGANVNDMYGGTCDLCGEVGTANDPVAEWVDPTKSQPVERYQRAHGQCGEDAGYELA
jgi:hypothetical protein